MFDVTLSIFALPMVLFPRTRRVLHIFEPRYRALLEDCLGSNRRFGLTCVPDPAASDPFGTPPIFGTLAHIRDLEGLPDGRSLILVEGTTRYQDLRDVTTNTPYPKRAVRIFEDDPPTNPTELEVATVALRALLDDHPWPEDTRPFDFPQSPWQEDGASLSFQVAGRLSMDLNGQLALLGERQAAARLKVVIPLVTEALKTRHSAAQTPPPGPLEIGSPRSNGKLDHT